jgi:calcineurin-like phosphoesterase family protein
MNYYIISDTHFGHEKMCDCFGRPYNFDKKIYNNINRVVKSDDVLIHLGDVCIGNDKKWNNLITDVECYKWLIRGNHDSKSIQWYLSNGWDFVGDSISFNMFGLDILFTHIPSKGENISISDFYDINIHGHLHNSNHHEGQYIKDNKQYLISMENNNYQPYNLKNIAEEFKNGTRKNSLCSNTF